MGKGSFSLGAFTLADSSDSDSGFKVLQKHNELAAEAAPNRVIFGALSSTQMRG